MPYVLKKSNGRVFVTIPDGSIDQSTAITFLGKNYAGYGQVIGQNFLYLMENFASISQPKNPIQGQLWYDSANLQLKIYDGFVFDPINLTQLSSVAPATGNNGDLWFNTTNNTLNIWNNSWQTVSGSGGSSAGLSQQNINDVSNVSYLISILSINDDKIAVISKDEFIVNALDPLQSLFPVVKKGITLSGANSASGVSSALTTTNYLFWGTAASAISMSVQSDVTSVGQASTSSYANSVAVRDTAGNIWATNFIKSDGTTIGGFTGSRGTIGFTGSIGSAGPAGPSGGPIGPIGPFGYTGSIGPAGAAGPSGGPAGFTGSIGAGGTQGYTGSGGPTVYIQSSAPPSGVNGDFWVVTA
jgi:hypothetical protein